MGVSPNTPLLGGPSKELSVTTRKSLRSASLFVVAVACVALSGFLFVGFASQSTPAIIELEDTNEKGFFGDVAKAGGTGLAKDDLSKVSIHKMITILRSRLSECLFCKRIFQKLQKSKRFHTS